MTARKSDAGKINPYDVACRYWSLPVDERTFGRVASDLGQKADSRVQNLLGRLVRQWELEGKVRHQVSQSPFDPTLLDPEYLQLLPGIEDEIRRHFGLRDVVVVDTSGIQKPPGSGAKELLERKHGEYDDIIHRRLGAWAARVLASVIRRGDVIGVGSGRGPYYTSAAVNLPPSPSLAPDSVVSLTGQMGVHAWQRNAPGGGVIPLRSLDADLIADALSKGLRANQPCKQMGVKITAKANVPLKRIKVALVGVGAFALGHRLVKYNESADLDDVQPLLARLDERTKDLRPSLQGSGPFHHWLGDLNNEVFVVDWAPPGTPPLPPERKNELQRIVEQLNGRFCSAKRSHLTKIAKEGAVIAVAGGLHKGAAVLHVLTSQSARRNSRRSASESGPAISHLVCDLAIAQYLRNAVL